LLIKNYNLVAETRAEAMKNTCASYFCKPLKPRTYNSAAVVSAMESELAQTAASSIFINIAGIFL
jgi:hypothetical protein